MVFKRRDGGFVLHTRSNELIPFLETDNGTRDCVAMATRRSMSNVTLMEGLQDQSSPWKNTSSARPDALFSTDAPPMQAVVRRRQKKEKNPRSLGCILLGMKLQQVKELLMDSVVKLKDGTKFKITDITCDTDPTLRSLREFNFHLEVVEAMSRGWKNEERMRIYSGTKMLDAVRA